MLNYKTYVKILSVLLISLFLGAFIYVYYFSKYYPIPFTHRISLDDKLRFIRDMPNKETVDTIIIGSSLGLNNIQGAILEDTSKAVKHVLNISAYGLKTTEVETQLQLISIFPNIKRVIYSAQFPDFSNAFTFNDYDLEFIKKYLTLGKNHTDIYHAFYAYKHIIEFTKNHWNWKKKYKGNMFNFGLAFDHTGSIPLKIYGKDINQKKFSEPHPLEQDSKNFEALDRMAKNLKDRNIQFYFIVDPYRQPLLNKHKDLRETMQAFIVKTNEIIRENDGYFLNLHPILKLSDKYFVDRFHLNEHGSLLTAKAISKFIDTNE
ncbi:MAG TPA: hypothetical protein ENK66_01120 [Arcobacter sp.]|nr:hypothetical protein [Arcobacter sp.]